MPGRRLSAAVVAFVVLVVATPVLTGFHHQPRQVLPARTAVRDALRSSAVQAALAGVHWTTASTSALDGRLERVSFLDGSRTVADVALHANGSFDQVEELARERVPYGDWVAYEPGVLASLAVLFVLMAGVAPLRRARNLDVLAALSLVLPVVLLQHGYVNASVVAALPGLGFLLVRCAWRGLGPESDPVPVTPLFELLTRRWEQRERLRFLRLLVVVLALVFAMLGLSSAGAADVAYAVMEGATRVIHGVLPYGHMPGDIIHGDTYPILSYALYAPLAGVAPVDSVLSSVDSALAVAVLAALATAYALFRSAAGPRWRSERRDPGAEAAGLRGAIVWLSFPPLLIIASAGTTDVALAAMLAFAVLLWRRPGASTAVLAFAGWFKLAPFALVPVWLAPLRGRRLAAAIGALAGVSAAALALVLALGGLHGLGAMVHAIGYQFDRGSLQSPWAALGVSSLQTLGQACALALIAGAAARLWRHPELAGDRGRMAALSAAILISVQLAASYWSFFYLAWILPLVGLSLLAEGAPATARVPEPIAADRRPVRRRSIALSGLPRWRTTA